MKAIVIARTGGPSVLEYADVPTPVPAAGEVLVRAVAIGVNRPDIQIRKGEYPWMPPLPAIPGIEMSGAVAAVGAGVAAPAAGAPVLVSARELPQRAGCYAEFIAVPATAVYPLPPGCDMEAAACLANYQVAHLMLTETARGTEGGTVFVGAAAGGIGGALVELARLEGRRVVAQVSSEAKAEAARRLGADHVVVTDTTDLTEGVLAVTGGAGVELAFDAVGGETLVSMFGLLAPTGLVISYGRLAGRRQADLYEAMFKHQKKNPGFRIFTMHSYDARPDVRRASMTALIGLLAAGRIAPPIHRRFALAEAAAAQTLLESRATTGKVILKP